MKSKEKAHREGVLGTPSGNFAFGEYFCSRRPRASSGRFARKMRTQSRALREDGFDARVPKRENCFAVLPFWHPQRESNP